AGEMEGRAGGGRPGGPPPLRAGAQVSDHPPASLEGRDPLERVTLFGATGTLGFRTFEELARRGGYHLTLLLLPGDPAAARLKPHLRAAGLRWEPAPAGESTLRVQDGAGLTL